ncbi:hypothetical protein R9C00_02815 [Flammeovirgaceae bacterium SG7u.111]|nr:hypothetical protein [Flammeovirgaceae bacterium SG7u.132]WPO36372.1 hypothetical protein R9C00_02815 [Flammeovirgaceae bacterium SG7u.111]
MKKYITLFCIVSSLTFLTSFSYAQINLQPAQIITAEGDSLMGQIDYQNWEKNPSEITFVDESGTSHQYSPLDIKRFFVANDLYEGAIVQANNESNKLEKLSRTPEIKLRQDTTFLQVLQEAVNNKTLYYYLDYRSEVQFYFLEKGKIRLLYYKRYKKMGKTGDVTAEVKRFQGQLSFYLQDCEKINSLISTLKYNKKSLIKAFTEYNNCLGGEVKYTKTKEKVKVNLGVLAGVTSTKLNFEGNSDRHITNHDYPASINFTFGGFADIVLPRNRGKWSINNELVYTSYKFENTYENIESENEYNIYYSNIAYSYLNLKNMLRYRIIGKRVLWHINLGISNGLAVSTTNSTKKESKFYSRESVEYKPAVEFSRKHEQGIFVGLGGSINKASIELRYEQSNGMSESIALNSKVNRLFLMFAYRFGQ